LPASLRQALADALVLDHPDAPWQPPAVLPPAVDLRAGIAILEAQTRPVDRRHAAHCIAKLLSGFNERLTKEEAELRLEVWLEACGHVPNDLWSSATIELLQGWQRDKHYGRVPEASDLLAAVKARLDRRLRDLERCRIMLRSTSATAVTGPKPLPRGLDRLRHTRAIYERLGRTADVARIDREIAGERPERPTEPLDLARTERQPFQPPDTPTARRLAELAAAKRTGKPAPEQRDVPEQRHG
jgi:hypothetical protein